MTMTEKVHVIFGAAAAVTGALALWGIRHPESRARVVWPVLAFLIGFFLFIPVEAGTRTYQDMPWWQTLGAFIPEHPGTWLRDWLATARQPHALQHKVGSAFAMLAGVIEMARARGRLQGAAWGLALPALLIGVGVAFGVHGGTAAHLPHRAELVHHQLLGMAFGVAGLTLALVRAGKLRAHPWQAVWAVLLLIVGLDIALFYRIPEEALTNGGHHHESPGPR